jgi:uncharacterized protein (DUF952 family)
MMTEETEHNCPGWLRVQTDLQRMQEHRAGLTEETQSMRTIFHITSEQSWEQAQRAGSYSSDTLDSEGFIHCSTTWQVMRIANRMYRGQSDLVLLTIDADKLQAPMRYERPTDNPYTAQRFPHIYGPINLDAVIEASPLVPGENGLFSMKQDTKQER